MGMKKNGIKDIGKSSGGKETASDMVLSDEDIYEAMKDIPGYLDITPEDFKDLYHHAYRHALDRMARSIKARDVMTREVVWVKRETPLQEVAEKMEEKEISGVPVIGENGTVAGVISEKDFLSQMSVKNTKTCMGLVAECLKVKGCLALSIGAQKASDMMTSPAVTVDEDTPIVEISNTLSEKNINRVPVTDQHGHLTGIVSRADIVRIF